ncbi:MAG: hypothetical protein HC857_10920, partial [Synechococcales cyanobacterium RU_4_20]|nr:hypothetical protein [Synechococcales cyanobacterium RU_4_20]
QPVSALFVAATGVTQTAGAGAHLGLPVTQAAGALLVLLARGAARGVPSGTGVAAATAGFSIDQGSELPQLLTLSEDKTTGGKTLTAEPLYLQTTVRSGAEVRHPGSVIIMGDLNPGSSVVADGDILIWGRLRGVAHAGAAGNKGSIILALKLEPTQLRIADSLARVPQTAQGPTRPEVAYVTAKGDIRITEAAGFTRPYR